MHYEAQGKVSDEFKIPPERCLGYCFAYRRGVQVYGSTRLVVDVHTGLKAGENEHRKGAMVAVILSLKQLHIA